jgi:hypothetical protein
VRSRDGYSFVTKTTLRESPMDVLLVSAIAALPKAEAP